MFWDALQGVEYYIQVTEGIRTEYQFMAGTIGSEAIIWEVIAHYSVVEFHLQKLFT